MLNGHFCLGNLMHHSLSGELAVRIALVGVELSLTGQPSHSKPDLRLSPQEATG